MHENCSPDCRGVLRCGQMDGNRQPIDKTGAGGRAISGGTWWRKSLVAV